MTGKELIFYILQHNLENENLLDDNNCMCLLDEKRLAAQFNVGVETIRVMEKLGLIRGIKLGNVTFYPKLIHDPRLNLPTSGGDD